MDESQKTKSEKLPKRKLEKKLCRLSSEQVYLISQSSKTLNTSFSKMVRKIINSYYRIGQDGI